MFCVHFHYGKDDFCGIQYAVSARMNYENEINAIKIHASSHGPQFKSLVPNALRDVSNYAFRFI